ncbi:hypothetical protein BDB00DRAFT_874524 [Zychaea mexicana]|uniref:uncharacterized protein n=1 Tax=Zychaea mexicana TaxID=64656 RepID=UPI0022FDDF83|nr:uncharacterized protein BDB00DRAFT_874524 [Zychaea mexicana]KAI9491292.1 hypothetical protein BDB00DRAFT_874524 [Zychaea mexicana]
MEEWFKTFHLELLDVRATACGQEGLFDSALTDAHEVIEYDPTRIIGYPCVGDLYVAQGKPGCAIQVYDQCLQHLRRPITGNLLSEGLGGGQDNHQVPNPSTTTKATTATAATEAKEAKEYGSPELPIVNATALVPAFDVLLDGAAEHVTSIRLADYLESVTDHIVARMTAVPQLQSLWSLLKAGARR